MYILPKDLGRGERVWVEGQIGGVRNRRQKVIQLGLMRRLLQVQNKGRVELAGGWVHEKLLQGRGIRGLGQGLDIWEELEVLLSKSKTVLETIQGRARTQRFLVRRLKDG